MAEYIERDKVIRELEWYIERFPDCAECLDSRKHIIAYIPAAEGGMSMGVYIKGMEMPKNCHSCPMCFMRFCQAGDRELSERETRPNAKRPEDCPLVPVPPHGRLIEPVTDLIDTTF